MGLSIDLTESGCAYRAELDAALAERRNSSGEDGPVCGYRPRSFARTVLSGGDGHGRGGHAGMSMAEMVRDMRNRFLVGALFAVPIALWSPVGEFFFGETPAAPFGNLLAN